MPDFVTGGIAAPVLRGMPFSVTAGIGFIATFGVAILDRVVFASCTGEERAEGKDSLEAAEMRLRPWLMTVLMTVLMTALVASIGFLPMTTSTRAGAEVQRPLATVEQFN